MRIARRVGGVIIGLALVLSLGGGAASQGEAASRQLCLVIAGQSPEGGWTQESLQEALVAREARITLVAGPDVCASLTETSTDAPEAEGRLPVEVTEWGLVSEAEGAGSFVVLLTNTNTSSWAAEFMLVTVHVLDDAGLEVESALESISLLPGQTSAITGQVDNIDRATILDVSIGDTRLAWVRSDAVADEVEISEVTTNESDIQGASTTGRVRNGTDRLMNSVVMTAVYRDKDGNIIGSQTGFVPAIAAGDEVPFEVPFPRALDREQVDDTEVYFNVLTGLASGA